MSSIIREMQIKTTIRYHLTSVRMPIINKQQVLARMWRKENPSALLGRVQIGAANVESSMELPQKIKDGALTSVVQLVGHHPTERKWPVQLPVKAHAWAVGQFPVGGVQRQLISVLSHINVSLPLSSSFPSLQK